MLGEDRLRKDAALRGRVDAVARGRLVQKLMYRHIEAVRGNKSAGATFCIEFSHGISLSVDFSTCQIPLPGEAALLGCLALRAPTPAWDDSLTQDCINIPQMLSRR